MTNRLPELMRWLVELPRIWKVQFLFAAPIGSIALGMLDHPIFAIAWYIVFTLLFLSIAHAPAHQDDSIT